MKVTMIVKTCVSRPKKEGVDEAYRCKSTCKDIFRQSHYPDIQRLETDKHQDTRLSKRRNENHSTSTLPILHKTGPKPWLTSNRIYIWCFCDDKGVHREERMAPKCIWCCWRHIP